MEKKFNKKIQLILAITITILLTFTTVSLAWFSFKTGINSVLKVKKPSKIQILAGHMDDVSNLDIGTISFETLKGLNPDEIIINEDGTYSKQYVFCVCAEKDDYPPGNYCIQLGHTKNIMFEYSIYRAEEVETTDLSNIVEYKSEDGSKYYYEKGNKIELSKEETSLFDTYDETDNVQSFAEPEYHKTTSLDPSTDSETDNYKFVDYYILEVTWGKNISTDNYKETDMVYLVVYEDETKSNNKT